MSSTVILFVAIFFVCGIIAVIWLAYQSIVVNTRLQCFLELYMDIKKHSKGVLYITRDKNGKVQLHKRRPYKIPQGEHWWSYTEDKYPMEISDCNYFDDVNWSDDKPTQLVVSKNFIENLQKI